jgi:hypothetical protein
MISVLVLVSFLLLFAPPLFAQQSYGEFERGLDLSESQRAQANNLRNKYIGEWRTLKDESIRKRMELRDLDRRRPGQGETAGRLERELGQIEASRQRLYRQYRGEMSTILNERQRDRYNTFVERERRRPMGPPLYRPIGPRQYRPAAPLPQYRRATPPQYNRAFRMYGR